MRMPRRAGTYDATVATTSRTSAVTANVHGSSGSTWYSNRSSSRVSAPAATSPATTPIRDEAQRLAEHEAQHRGRRRAERHADADFLRPLPHRVRHHAVDADRRERERDEREHADQHRHRARTRDRVADDLFERADSRPAPPVPSTWTTLVTLVASNIGSCWVRTKNVMPRPGRCVLGTKMVWRTGPSSVDLMLPTTPTTVHSTSSLPLAWSKLTRRRRPSGSAVRELLPHELFADDRDGRRVHGVGLGEVASGHLWNPHRPEESRRDRPHLAGWQLAVRRLRPIDAPEARADAGERHRQARGPCGVLNPGQRGNARQRFAEEAAGLREVVSRGRKLLRPP